MQIPQCTASPHSTRDVTSTLQVPESASRPLTKGMRFGPRSLFCQDPKAILDALKLERDLLDKVHCVANHQLQRLRMEEFALEHLNEELQKEKDPLGLLRPSGEALRRGRRTALVEDDMQTVRESLSTVQDGVTGHFPDVSPLRSAHERPDGGEGRKGDGAPPAAKRHKGVEKYPVLERLTRREREMSTADEGNAASEKQPPPQSGSRYDTLKRAAIDHYQTGISLKNAAKKHGVGVRELKEFYENEAGDFLQKANFASSDESQDDP